MRGLFDCTVNLYVLLRRVSVICERTSFVCVYGRGGLRGKIQGLGWE